MVARILYVEDDPGHGRLGSKRLARAGYEVELSETAEAALALLDARPFDVVLTDLNLPGMSGLELLAELSKRNRPAPTIVVTGRGSENSAVEAMKVGARDYVVKDVEGGYLDLLPLVVHTVLDNERVARERQAALDALKESEERYRRLFENVPIGLYRVSDSGKIIDANRKLVELLGEKDPETVKGKNLLDFYVMPEERERRAQTLTDYVIVDGFEARFRDTTGRVFWVLEYAAPVFDHVGSFQTVDGSLQDVSERKRVEEHLAFLAAHDALTGLPNRSLLNDRMGQALSRARRHRTTVGVLVIDLDDFKQVNDKHGHEVGDAVLIGAARVFSDRLRATDTVSRFGGDEFVIVLGDMRDAQACEHVARQILDLLRRLTLDSRPGIRTTASIGIAVFPTDGDDSATLIKRADQAMYEAKSCGGDTCAKWTESIGRP